MLEAIGIEHHYDNGPWIFRALSLTVNPGEVVGLPGPSGMGKSTLAKILAGHLRPRGGLVSVDGTLMPVPGYCPVQLIFQHPELAMNPRWTGREIIAEGRNPDPALLEALNINPQWLARHPHELSGGELQRLAVARVMSSRTKYLIADEMTAMLDPNTQALIWDTVLSWARRDKVGILAISHDAPLLDRVADRQEPLFLAPSSPSVTSQAA